MIGERGSAILLAVGLTALMAAVGLGMLTVANDESDIARNYRAGHETIAAADAAIERALIDVFALPSWTTAPSGVLMSSFLDTTRTPVLPFRGRVDLDRFTTDLQARSSASARWGADSPMWHLYAYGPLAVMASGGTIGSGPYVVVWIADDQAETDGDPAIDSNGVVCLMARAFGSAGADRSIVVSVEAPAFSGGASSSTAAAGAPRVLSWREIR